VGTAVGRVPLGAIVGRFFEGPEVPQRTTNRARAGKPVDADVGVYFHVEDTSHFDMVALQRLIKTLLAAAYPQKSRDDFDDTGARTFGVVFKGTRL
jgi:hypothetical protein